jgi:lysyl-tRNA synthetase class 2
MTAVLWKPACSLSMLRMRAAMLQAVRNVFWSNDYLEVETPCLSRDIVIDAWLEPIFVKLGQEHWFLQTSPEAAMKRLLAAGSGSIFQISRVFRGGEKGPRHNPEFTMAEWYGVASTWEDQVLFTEALVRAAVDAVAQAAPSDCVIPNARERWPGSFQCLTYADAFLKYVGIDVHSATEDDLFAVTIDRGLPISEGCGPGDRDELLNVLLAFLVEPNLGCNPDGSASPVFLCDYPASQAALAIVSTTNPPVSRRFELYIQGLELCNGYQELTDPNELEQRELRQNQLRQESRGQLLPGAARLRQAMQAGLPQCSGVALGVDRLLMVAANATSIDEVMPFPYDRA